MRNTENSIDYSTLGLFGYKEGSIALEYDMDMIGFTGIRIISSYSSLSEYDAKFLGFTLATFISDIYD